MPPYVAPTRWWSTQGARPLGVVTGANKGIGFEIASGLAANQLDVVVAARDDRRGEAAAEALRCRPEVARSGAEVTFMRLDVSSDASVAAFKRELEKKAEKSGVAVLVNNAAIAYKGDTWGGDEAEDTINVNYRGTKRVTDAVVPLLVDGGRVVNVCSRSGQLERLFPGVAGGGGSPRSPRSPGTRPASDGAEVLARKWRSAAEAGDVAAVDLLCSEFVAAVREGTAGVAGWPRSMYGVSKLAQISYTRALALSFSKERDAKFGGRSLSAFAVCPGSVKTDMSSQRGTKTPEEGADTPVWLSVVPPASEEGNVGGKSQAKSGLFFAERQVIDF